MDDYDNTTWSGSRRYEEFMGKWSLKVAQKFLIWLKEDHIIGQKKWLDVGCGTGALTYEIVNSTDPIQALGIDPSKEYLPKSNSHIKDAKVEFKVGFANNLPVESNEFDIAVSALALNFMESQEDCIQEMLRTLKSNGTLALYVWDYSGKMEFLRYFWDAAIKIDSRAIKLDEGQIFPICNTENLRELLLKSGVDNVKTKELDIETYFSSFDEFWIPFMGGQGPAGSYVKSLDQNSRIQLKEKLKETLPILKDGSITLIARAFAIQGTK